MIRLARLKYVFIESRRTLSGAVSGGKARKNFDPAKPGRNQNQMFQFQILLTRDFLRDDFPGRLRANRLAKTDPALMLLKV